MQIEYSKQICVCVCVCGWGGGVGWVWCVCGGGGGVCGDGDVCVGVFKAPHLKSAYFMQYFNASPCCRGKNNVTNLIKLF